MQMDPRNNQQDTPDGIKQGENKSLVKGKTVFSQRPNHAILLNFITNKVTSHFFITLSKSIAYTSFSRSTD